MPFLQPHTGPDRGEHPDAYWTPARIELNLADEVGTVVYRAYHDAAAWAEGAAPIAGAERTFVLAGAEFRAAVAALLAGTVAAGEILEAPAAADPAFAAAQRVPFPTP